MPRLTVDEQIELVLGTIEIGKRKEARKNLRYIVTELGGTFVTVEEGKENE